MSDSLIVEKILLKYKITDYLHNKGFTPIAQSTNKIKYICPIHKETDASFMVYVDEEGAENFFCFGCKAGGNFLNLYSKVENKGIKATIEKLGEGIQISNQAQLDFILDKIKGDIEKSRTIAKNDLAELSMKLSVLSYNVLEMTDYSPFAFNFMENVYKIIDYHISEENYDALEKIYNSIVKEKLLSKKIKQINNAARQTAKENMRIGNIVEEESI